MAITVIKENLYSAYPMRDSRAEGYVTYYTKMKWDRFKMAAEQVAQEVADNAVTHDAALKFYQTQVKDIQDERQSIQKQINDIVIKRADVIRKVNEIEQKQETERARLLAKTPSTSSSTSTGTSQSTGTSYWYSQLEPDKAPKVIGATGQTVQLDQARLDAIKTSAAASLKEVEDARIPDDNATTTEVYVKTVVDPLKAKGYSDDEIKVALSGSLSNDLSMALPPELTASKVSSEAAAKAGVGAGARVSGERQSTSDRQSTHQSTGSYQTDYEIALNREATNGMSAITEYEQRLADLEEQLKSEGLQTSLLQAPVIEPIDVITATRKAYFDKFGDVPRNTRLNIQGEKTQHKGVAPFELTAAMHKTEQFFKMYVDDAVATAKAHAVNAQGVHRELSVDELNAAVEEGKKRARDVLFGGLAERERAQSQRDGTNPPPNAANEPPDIGMMATTARPEDFKPPNVAADTAMLERLGVIATDKNAAGKALGELGTLFPGNGIPDQFPSQAPTAEQVAGLKPVIPGSGDPIRQLMKRDISNYNQGQEVTSSQGASGGTPTYEKLPGLNTRQYPKVDTFWMPSLPWDGFASKPDIGIKQEGEIPRYASPINLDSPEYNPFPPVKVNPQPEYKEPWMPSTQPGLVPEKKKYPTGPVEQESKRIINADDKDRMAKAKAFMEAAKSVDNNPSVVASKIVKTPAGKYVAALYDENKAKGAQAKDIGTLVQQVTREYAGDSAAQKAAVQRLIELSMLDSNSKKLS